MTVYVDGSRNRLGRMVMSHMVADTDAELVAMADRIGVARRWHQGDHFDICQAKRVRAILAGAIVISSREAVLVRRRYRAGRSS